MNKPMCFKTAFRPLTLKLLLSRNFSSGGRTSFGTINHYEVLGVQRGASTDDIRNAFLKLSKECHPDINTKDPRTHDKFIQVNEAYSILSKGLSRRNYDLSLKARESSHYPYASPPGPNNHQSYNQDARAEFHDPHIYSMRDKSQDHYYESQPYYGIQGISRISNKSIVLACMGIIVVGGIFIFFTVKKSSSLHIKNLNDRDMKIHKLWQNANDPTMLSERLLSLQSQIQEDRRMREESNED